MRMLKSDIFLAALTISCPGNLPPRPAVSAVREQWTRGALEQRCEAFNATTIQDTLREELLRIPLPDSADAVALALRALDRAGPYSSARVTAFTRAPNGILIAFDLVSARTPEARAAIRDGTATVYVGPGRCVALLGW